MVVVRGRDLKKARRYQAEPFLTRLSHNTRTRWPVGSGQPGRRTSSQHTSETAGIFAWLVGLEMESRESHVNQWLLATMATMESPYPEWAVGGWGGVAKELDGRKRRLPPGPEAPICLASKTGCWTRFYLSICFIDCISYPA